MSALFESRALADAAAEKLRVFAQPQRLMILSCLMRGEKTVGGIDAATGIGQPALSQQLAELRRAELVQTRKEAKQVWYALADDGVAHCVRTMELIFGAGESSPSGPRPAPARPEPGATETPIPPGVAGFARIL